MSNLLLGQIFKDMKLEINNNMHLLEVIEPVMKDVLFEKSIGENAKNHNPDIQQECLIRLKKIYSESEIETLKKNVPENYAIPFDRKFEILQKLIEYTIENLNPELRKIQKLLYSQLSSKEVNQLSELKDQYRNAINLKFDQKRNDILANNELDVKAINVKLKQLELEHKLILISPNLTEVWKIKSQEVQLLNEVSKKYDFVVQEAQIDFRELLKGRFNIKIGRLGNFVSAVMYFDENKEKLETVITKEVLLLN